VTKVVEVRIDCELMVHSMAEEVLNSRTKYPLIHLRIGVAKVDVRIQKLGALLFQVCLFYLVFFLFG